MLIEKWRQSERHRHRRRWYGENERQASAIAGIAWRSASGGMAGPLRNVSQRKHVWRGASIFEWSSAYVGELEAGDIITFGVFIALMAQLGMAREAKMKDGNEIVIIGLGV